jgi:GTPase SAR1 family protein
VPHVVIEEQKVKLPTPTTQSQPAAEESAIRAATVGPQAADQRTEIRILVVGQTGSGKTTFLNGIANWLYGVQWEDDYRFKIVTDDDEGIASGGKGDQSKSQTNNVTAYTFGYQDDFPIRNTVTVIDTPGFGDTRGIKRDEETVIQLEQLFKAHGRCGIDSIDAVAFVVQSSLARLDNCQPYIFDSILKIFGKDIADNIIVVATFSDAGKPQVLQALMSAQIPHTHLCKFNNSALFAPVGGPTGTLNRFFWDIGVENYRLFFQAVGRLQPKSLILTKQVLDERRKLQATIEGLAKTIRDGVAKMNEIEQDCHLIEQYRREIEANKHFEEPVKTQQSKKVDLPPGEYVTNCQVCNMTCHYPCSIPRDEDKHQCSAMRGGQCTVCPKRCSWHVHHNMPWRWELYEVVETRTLEGLKARYGDATQKKQTKEQMLDNAGKQYIELWEKTGRQMDQARECVNLLQSIAARPVVLSEIDYVELQIEGEKRRAQFGWQQRVQWLEEVLQRAKLMKSIYEGKGIDQQLPPDGRLPFTMQDPTPEAQGFFRRLIDKLRSK